MRTLLFTGLILLAAGVAMAGQEDRKILAGEWQAMPTDARIAYVAGAISGKRAYLGQNPDGGKTRLIMLDMALEAMNSLATNPANGQMPLMAVAANALEMAQSEVVLSPHLAQTQRDLHFDNTLLFTDPRLEPLDLDAMVPKKPSGPRPSPAASWLSAANHQKEIFLTGFGDLVVMSCLLRYGDNSQGSACARPLLPIPMGPVLSAVDDIYRDPKNAALRSDIVIRAALHKVVGDDWQGYLKGKY
jgi:hypothetical protein